MDAVCFGRAASIPCTGIPANQQTSTVPRHGEIINKLAMKICKDLGIPTIG